MVTRETPERIAQPGTKAAQARASVLPPLSDQEHEDERDTHDDSNAKTGTEPQRHLGLNRTLRFSTELVAESECGGSIDSVSQTETERREATSAAPRDPAVPVERAVRVTTIRPAPRWPHLDVRELWQYRELLGRLAWRDIAVRQADLHRCRVGDSSALPDDGRLHVRLREIRELPL